MVKRLFLVILCVFLWGYFDLPAYATQELDANSDGKIDDALFDAYGNLSTNSKIGTGAAQVSQGNHTHTGMVSGPGTTTAGALECSSGTTGYVLAACGNVGTAGIMKWGATGIPTTATAGSDYIATETDPIVLAINGIVKSNTSTISAATAADYSKATIVGTIASPVTTNPYTLSAANSYGSTILYGPAGTGEVDLPAGVAGMNLCVREVTNQIVNIIPNGANTIIHNSSSYTTFTISAGIGNFACFAFDGASWVRFGYQGTISGS